MAAMLHTRHMIFRLATSYDRSLSVIMTRGAWPCGLGRKAVAAIERITGNLRHAA